jgi:hypothetical protein
MARLRGGSKRRSGCTLVTIDRRHVEALKTYRGSFLCTPVLQNAAGEILPYIDIVSSQALMPRLSAGNRRARTR